MSIEIKGKVYRNLQEQVEKNKEDIEAITKDKTVTIYTHILTIDVGDFDDMNTYPLY